MNYSRFVSLGVITMLGLVPVFGCNKPTTETPSPTTSAAPSNNTTTDKPKETTSSELSGNSFTAVDLSQKYKSDKKGIDEKLKGKEVILSGTVSIDPVGKPGESSLISLDGVGINTPQCWYEKEDQPAFGKLKKGQEVTVSGIFSGRFDSPEMRFCKVVEKSSAPSRQTGEVLMAVDLSQKYKADKKALDEKYKGKEVTLKGVLSIDPTGKSGESGLISLEGVGVTGNPQCWYEKEDQAAFGSLKKGQEVALKGIFSGRFDSPDMEFCKVVEKK